MAGRTYEIKNFALRDQIMESVHDFFDASGVIPPMKVEDIYVVRAKLAQRILYRDMHRLGIVSGVMRALRNFRRTALVVGCVL